MKLEVNALQWVVGTRCAECKWTWLHHRIIGLKKNTIEKLFASNYSFQYKHMSIWIDILCSNARPLCTHFYLWKIRRHFIKSVLVITLNVVHESILNKYEYFEPN